MSDERITELLAANNREVERRRHAEQECRNLRASLDVLSSSLAASESRGLERAAAWHSEQAMQETERALNFAVGSVERRWHMRLARQHEDYAASIRAQKATD